MRVRTHTRTERGKNKHASLFSERWYNFAFVVLLCLVGLGHIAYVVKTSQYPQWDEHNYLALAIKYLDIFRTPTWDIWNRMLAVTGYLQPLYSATVAVLVWIFGTTYTYTIALLLNGVFLMASIAGVFAVGSILFDRKTGLIAAIILAGLGNFLFYSHFTYTEIAVTASIIWSILFLLKTQGFRDRKFSVLAGVFTLLAVLTRWIALVFIAGPILVEAVRWIMAFAKSKNKHIAMLLAPAIFGVIAFGIPLFLYFIPNWTQFSEYVARNQQSAAQWVAIYRFAEMANTFSTRSVMYYFNILSQNTIYIFVPFLGGFLYCLAKFKSTCSLILGFAVPYAFLTFVAVWKEDRFLVPLYPVFSLITASVFHAVRLASVRFMIAVFFVLLSGLTYMGGAWGVGPMGKRGLTDVVLPEFIHHPRRIYLTSLVWPPTREYLNAHLIADTVDAFAYPGRTPIVAAAYTFEPLDNAIYSIISYHDRDRMIYRKAPSDYLAADFVLTKSNDPETKNFETSDARTRFRLIANIPVPMDNSTVAVYKHEN